MTGAPPEAWPLGPAEWESLGDAVRQALHHGREATEHARRAGGVLHKVQAQLTTGRPLDGKPDLFRALFPFGPPRLAREFVELYREHQDRARLRVKGEDVTALHPWHDLDAMTRSINRGQEGDYRGLEAALAGAAQLVTRQRRSLPNLAAVQRAAEALARACEE